MDEIESVLQRIRAITTGTPYEGVIYVVGGYLRDRVLGLAPGNDIDLVLDGDAIGLAEYLYKSRTAIYRPVTYPRFGTAMVQVPSQSGSPFAVELVSARSESYASNSRKPSVTRSSLLDDALRRDFTINTLMRNIHTDELLDLTKRALDDLEEGILRTPRQPEETFYDDPLRMLRAVRIAVRLGFRIEEETWEAIKKWSPRLTSQAISPERIREEFTKIVDMPGDRFKAGMEMMSESSLLSEFMPEILPMQGCIQGGWHTYDVWNHTLEALTLLPDEAPRSLRLAVLWHDIGKPPTRTEEDGFIHFYDHQHVGAELAVKIMRRLRFPTQEIKETSELIALHMRPGEYRAEWSDAAVRRFMRSVGDQREHLLTLVRSDQGAMELPQVNRERISSLVARMKTLDQAMDTSSIVSPLNGLEIMEQLNLSEGPILKYAKEHLIDEILEGNLALGDKEKAIDKLKEWYPNYIKAGKPGNLTEETIMSKIPISLQLYSVRDDCAHDLPGVLKSVAAMGYEGVEFAGFYGHKAEDVRAILDSLNLKCSGAHISIDQFNPEVIDETIEFHKALGNKFLIVPSLPSQFTSTKEAWLEAAQKMNAISDALAPHGMFTGYHNHHTEFHPLDGELPWDIFFGNTKKEVIMQFDTGNAMHGGAEAGPFLRKYPGRALTVHLKEYDGANDKALIGEGKVKWTEIFELCETVGATEWYVVEQESYAHPPMECVKTCLDNLRKMGK